MAQSNVTTWLQFALQQMAAESYLDGFSFSNTSELIRRLKFGNNNASTLGLNNPDETPNLPGKTRLTSIQAQQFVQRYQIKDQHANDSSGFSATLLYDTLTNSYALSFRSTEYQNQSAGGDYARDGSGADADISFRGFAFGQLAAMEKYYSDLKASGTLPTGAVLNVTGYSLGGHLATVFTELHANDSDIQFGQTVTFNGVGQGHITGGTEATEDARIAGMLNLLRAVLLDPDAGLTVIGDNTAPDYVAAKALHDKENVNPFTPFVSETSPGAAGNLYTDARYQWAVDVVRTKYTTSGTIGLPPPGEVGTGVGFDKITQLFGHANHNDSEYVANRGVHGSPTSVFIEDQPNLDGFGGIFGLNGDFGTTHSITLIADSLVLMETFQAVDSNVTQTTLGQIFSAASNQTGSGTTIVTGGIAEGNSLENTLDALRRIFLGNVTPTNFGRQTGDFGNLAFRNPFYQNMAELTDAVQTAKSGGQTFTITPLTSFSATTLSNAAEKDSNFSIAYRYALKELNPFTVLGANSQQTEALYAQHNVDGALGLESEGGLLTLQYLKDRAEFLEEKVLLNVADADVSNGNVHFVDRDPYEITTTVDPDSVREFIFGSDAGEADIMGNSADDHLYGGGGDDTLTGGAGNDYLEGDKGNDLIEGGAGFDTYVYRINDNLDTINDSDGRGRILYDTHAIDGGIRKATDPANTYHGGAQGSMTYVWAGPGTDLTINNLITVQGFQNGNLGIHLTTAPDTQISQPTIDFSNTLPVRTELWGPVRHSNEYDYWYVWEPLTIPADDGFIYTYIVDPQTGPPYPLDSSPGNHNPPAPPTDFTYIGDAYLDLHLGNGSNEIVAGPGADQLLGGNASDSFSGSAGNDQLFGGEGDDYLWGETYLDSDFLFSGMTGDDFLDGGPGNDWLFGDEGNDVLLGGVGNDQLRGDDAFAYETFDGGVFAWNDYLDGGEGDDTLKGFGGNDMLIGGEGDDTLMGDNDVYLDEFGQQNYSALSAVPGDDVFDGGAGNDILIGNTGTNVILFGRGSGQDRVSEPDNVAMFERVHYSGLSPEDLQGTDIIQFGEDVSSGDVTVREDTNLGLVLSITGTTDQITVSNFFSSSFSQSSFSQVIQVAFADGTVWGESVLNGSGVGVSDVITAGPGNNLISAGGGDDTIIGGAGNDTLDGGRGNDTYVFDLGDGVDTIIDIATAGEGNVVAFGDAITPGSLSLGLGSLLIRYGNQGDAIHIKNFDPNDTLGTHAIEAFQFADGTVLSYSDLIGRGFDLAGTAGDDTIIGTSVVDRIMGLAGNDALQSGDGDDVLDGGAGDDQLTGGGGDDVLTGGVGNDVLIGDDGGVASGGGLPDPGDVPPGPGDGPLDPGGGLLDPVGIPLVFFGGSDVLDGGEGDDGLMGNAGNDTLIGGAGNDIYVFGLGDGMDRIHDTAGLGQGNGIFFAPGITPGDLTFTQNQNTLTIAYGVGGDAVILEDFDPNNVNGSLVVSTLHFADGSSVSMSDLFPPTDVNHAPTVANPVADLTVNEDAPFSLAVPADTFADEDIGDTRTYSATLANGSLLPVWLAFDATTGIFSGMPGNGDVGSVNVTVTATDSGNLSAADTFALTVTNVNDAPTLAQALADQATAEDSPFSFAVPANTFADVDAGDSLTLSASLASGDVLPGWLSFDAATGTFSGTPTNGDVGNVNVTVTATDQGSLSAADTFALTVTNANDAPTLANSIADQSMLEDAAFSFVVPAGTFADVDAGDTLTLSAMLTDGNPLPAWLAFDTATQSFTGTPDNGDVGSVNVTVTVTDSGNLSASNTFGLTVVNVNDAPTVASPIADQTAVEDAPFSFQAPVDTFVDVDAGDVLAYSALSADGNALPAWLSFDAAMRTFSGTPGYDEIGTVGVTVTAMDNGGLNAVDTFALTVRIAPDQVVVGTDGDDALKTSSGNDVIDARGGNDTVTAGRGNDTITGGTGNDLLNGGTGNDTYIYERGGGLDQVADPSGVDTVSFGAGISFDTTVARLTTAAGLTTAHLRLLDAGGSELPDEGMDFALDAGGVSPIERFAFADGTTLALSDLVIQAKATQGTNGSDVVRTGRHDDVIETGNGDDRVYAGTGHDTVYAGNGKDSLYGEGGNDTLYGANGEDFLDGGGGNDLLDGGNGKDTLQGGPGDDALDSGNGADTILFGHGDGQDTLIGHGNNQGDAIRFSSGINPIDLVLSRQANDLRVAIHGSDDRMTIQNWYADNANQAKEFEAGSGSVLHDQKVDQLIQAMAQFSSESGLSWDQAIDQRPQDVQTILAASWQ